MNVHNASTMILFDETGAAALLVALTLCFKCAGIAVLVNWLRKVTARNICEHSIACAAGLVMRTTIAIVALQDWLFCFGPPVIAGSAFRPGSGVLLLSRKLFDGRLWRRAAPLALAPVGAAGEHDGGADVLDIRKPAVCADQ